MEPQLHDIYTWIGTPYPLGSSIKGRGTNFSVYSKSAIKVTLNLYDSENSEAPSHQFELDTALHKQGSYWCIWVSSVDHGQLYSFSVEQYRDTYGKNYVLVDPYAEALVIPKKYKRNVDIENHAEVIKSQVIDHSIFDWGNDLPPRHPFNKTVVYELHCSGQLKLATVL